MILFKMKLDLFKTKSIDDYKADWEAAHAIGDKEGMAKAHAGAEALRAEAGYSGGATGDEFINIGTSTNRAVSNGKNRDSNTGVITTTDKLKKEAASALAKGSTQGANAILSFLTDNYGDSVAAGTYNISKNDRGAEVPDNWLAKSDNGAGSMSLPSWNQQNGWNRNEIIFTGDAGNPYVFAGGEIYKIGRDDNLASGLSDEELLRRAIETGQVDTSTWGTGNGGGGNAPAGGGNTPYARSAYSSGSSGPALGPNGYPIANGNYPNSGWEPYVNDILAQMSRTLTNPPEFNYQGSEWDAIREALAKQYVNQNYTDWTQGDEYAALRDRYTDMGRQAMQDTLGQVSSRTGGLASSYAGSAAQQAMNSYMAQLEPQARQQFASLMDTILGQWNTAGSMADLDYNRYVDKYGYDRQNWLDTADGLNTMYGAYTGQENQAYNRFRDDQNYALQQQQWNTDQDWKAKQWEQSLLEYQDSKDADARKEAQDQINMILMSGGSLSDIPADLIERSGWGTATLTAAERTAQQAIAEAKAKGTRRYSGNPKGNPEAGDGGTDWSSVEAWVEKYGDDAASNYIGAHYRDLGYKTKSEALADWQNHLLEWDRTPAFNEVSWIYPQGSDVGGGPDGGEYREPTITNTHGTDWVNVNGFPGRVSFEELYDMVQNGEVRETYDRNKHAYTYTYIQKR